MLQLYRLLYNCAKTGGKSAVVALCDAGVVKTFANLARAPHHPEFVWDSEMVMPVVMLLKLLTSADQRRVADLGSQGAMHLAFAAGVAFTLAGDKKLVEIGACVCFHRVNLCVTDCACSLCTVFVDDLARCIVLNRACAAMLALVVC